MRPSVPALLGMVLTQLELAGLVDPERRSVVARLSIEPVGPAP